MIEVDAATLPVARKALFEHYRERRVTAWIEATGCSMSPLIRPGTWLLVDFGARDAGLGEIAVFAVGDTIVSHRVVRRPGPGLTRQLITKGDAVLTFDAPVGEDDLFGVVRALRHAPDEQAVTATCRGTRAAALARISAGGGTFASWTHALPAPLGLRLRGLAERVVSSLLALGGRLPSPRAAAVPDGSGPPG